ncbi:MAG: hypothetical protein EOP32_35525 [Rhodococcus sp. (in: high G+C Gram-positive bacteria)]|nr:MAG: hypothetical protein EOP32_35525 [Rhodococcus sp. (in: high G+C Gram-positive bacteria)]
MDLCATAVQYFDPDRSWPARAEGVQSPIPPASADFVAATCFTHSRFPFRTAPFDDTVPEGGRRDRLFGAHTGPVRSPAVVRAGRYA